MLVGVELQTSEILPLGCIRFLSRVGLHQPVVMSPSEGVAVSSYIIAESCIKHRKHQLISKSCTLR